MAIVEKHHGRLGGLLFVLQDIQLAVGYLPESALQIVSEATGRPLAEVYGFADFHGTFRFRPEAPDHVERPARGGSTEHLSVNCPFCNHTLLDTEHLIGGFPSVRVTVSFAMEHGWLRLPSSSSIALFDCEYELPSKGTVNFFCPHCSAELLAAGNCAICGAPMIPQMVEAGFTGRCSRSDCTSISSSRVPAQPSFHPKARTADIKE